MRRPSTIASLIVLASAAGLGVVAPVVSASTIASRVLVVNDPFDEKAVEVLERAIEAQFGEHAKKRSVKSMRMTGRMSMPAQGINAQIEVLQSGGNMLTIVDIPGFGKMKEGFTDGQGWSFSELQGPAIKSDVENEQTAQQSDIYASLDYEAYFKSASYEGTETIKDFEGDDRETHVLLLVSKDGERTTKAYYDTETGHQIRTDTEVVMQGAKMPTSALMGDFRTVNGLTMPHKMRNTLGPMQQLMTINELEVNPTVDAERFATPDEVTALIDKKKAASDS
ncbi:MAG: hypothetical protein AAGH64_05890 [Planctomycetota bacterium]